MQVPRPAATVALLRDGSEGIESYLLVRNSRLEFAGGATVFPGGAVDDADNEPALFDVASGGDETELSARMGSPPGASGYWFAAVRECFEEVGVLLAGDGGSTPFDVAELHAYRGALLHDETSLLDVCRSLDVTLSLQTLRYFAHWITPAHSPRRYDTRFFVAPMPEGQSPDPDRGELVSGKWWTPADALEAHDADELELILPTQRSLAAIAAHRDVASLLAALDHADALRTVEDSGGHRVHLPANDP
jgi:8-oxo-dGTP pyrophosphatase MutT (NUDIX family)